ncbi:MAG TPA: SMC-Scp complex subunit ScpB [Actinomycetes bacterium]|nr:SMC-Scp complex subunit ScpB [Actinomycetes bacterium]
MTKAPRTVDEGPASGTAASTAASTSTENLAGESVTESATPDEALALLALAPSIEAVLMVVDEPIPVVTLAQVLQRPVDDIAAELTRLADEYQEQGRGFELRQVAGGWRFYTAAAMAPVVERFALDGQQARLTQASLETLAVVAYRQPVSRARISAVRGVNVDGVMRTLLNRGLVEEIGTEAETGAHLYQTTPYFLERLGIASLDELPELAPYLPDLETLEAEL